MKKTYYAVKDGKYLARNGAGYFWTQDIKKALSWEDRDWAYTRGYDRGAEIVYRIGVEKKYNY